MGYSSRDIYFDAYRIYWFGGFVSAATNTYKGGFLSPNSL
jgi:hypothetical protein